MGERTTRIAAVALNTWREAIRNRVLYTLLFFAILMIGSGVLLSTLSYVEQERILQDIGLGAVRVFGVAIAIFVGVSLVHREVDRRTIYTILAKPISRAEFVLGKYFGLVLTVWMQVAIMGVAFLAVSGLAGAPVTATHGAALGLIGVEVVLVVAIATLFSTFSSPMPAAFFTTGLYLIGKLSRVLRDIGAGSDDEQVQRATALLYRLLPDLESFDLTIQAVHGLPVSAAPDVAWPVVYGMAYAALLLLGAVLVFDRRDLR